MKILLIAPGNSIHIERWCDWLSSNGNDVVLVTDKETNITTAKVYKLPNPHDHSYPLYWTITTQLNSLKVKSIVSRERPDIVHLHYASQYLTYRLNFSPFFVSIWGSDIFKLVEGTPGYEFARKNLDRADLVLTVSEQMKAIVENKFPFTKNKLDCFTWGIDVDFFKRGDRTKWRGELGLPLTGSFFIAPRGINDIYRPELIIQAFNLLKRTHKTIYLILLAGYASNERKKSIQNIIDKDPIQIIFIEDTVSQERMLGYYNSSDFYIGIPLYDQISAALLESMACGVIPIVSDIQSYKGLIVEDKNGFVFNGNDYESLSGLLNRAMNGKYNREMIRDNNINLVYDKFNWNDESKKMMAHYKRVIAQLY